MGKTGVIIGRFQVPALHKGHKHLIDTVRAENETVVFLVGTSTHIDARNPLPFNLRCEVLDEYLADDEKYMIYELPDQPGNDKLWSDYIDRLLDSLDGGVMLYGSRDSFIPHYLGKYPIVMVPDIEAPSGTAIRSIVNEEPLESPIDYRKGFIHAVNTILKN